MSLPQARQRAGVLRFAKYNLRYLPSLRSAGEDAIAKEKVCSLLALIHLGGWADVQGGTLKAEIRIRSGEFLPQIALCNLVQDGRSWLRPKISCFLALFHLPHTRSLLLGFVEIKSGSKF
jgi:hypothetical protein